MHSTTSILLACISLFAPTGCNFVVDHCIGNCELLSAGATTVGPEGTTSGSQTASADATDGASVTSAGDATTGSGPTVMLGTCEFIDAEPDAHCGDAILQPGDFCFGAGFSTALPPAVSSSLALRLDDDAAADLLLSHDDRTLTAVLNGPGAFDPQIAPWAQQFPQPGVLTLVGSGDLDEDGIADAVVRIQDQQDASLHALFLDGHGAIAGAALVGGFAHWLDTLDVVDWDADGHLDIVGVDTSVTMIVLRGDGHGGFTSTPGSVMPEASGTYAIGSFDVDGAADDFAFGVGSGPLVVTRNAPGVEPEVVNLPLTDDLTLSVFQLAIADLDQDGRGDVIAVGTNFGYAPATAEVVVALQSTGLTPTHYPVDCLFNTMAVGDLDGDALPDLVTVSSDGTVTARRNDGAGGFAQAVHAQLPFGAERVHIADINGDGGGDIVGVAESALGVLVNAF